MKLRSLVVDDERLARKLLEENIGQIPFLELAGSCKNAFEAMEMLQKKEVDLIFLDIQMPGMLGTKFIQSLSIKPMIIFVTAYQNYAVESYELEVIDYLVKPVSIERFTKAAYKAMEKQQSQIRSLDPSSTLSEAPESFFVNVEYALVKITIAHITHIEGMKDYVKIFLDNSPKPVMTKSTLKGIVNKLEENSFMRVHKSFIVNLKKIDAIRGNQLHIGSKEIPISESLRKELIRRIGG